MATFQGFHILFFKFTCLCDVYCKRSKKVCKWQKPIFHFSFCQFFASRWQKVVYAIRFCHGKNRLIPATGINLPTLLSGSPFGPRERSFGVGGAVLLREGPLSVCAGLELPEVDPSDYFVGLRMPHAVMRGPLDGLCRA